VKDAALAPDDRSDLALSQGRLLDWRREM